MNRSILVAAGVMAVCGAGVGVYLRHAAGVQRQLVDSDDRLNGAIIDLQASKDREATLTSELRAAADREGTLIADIADARIQLENARDDREVYKSALAVMLSSRSDPLEQRSKSALFELQRKFAAVSGKVDQGLLQDRNDVLAAERDLIDLPSSNAYDVYGRRLSTLKSRAELAGRMADNVASFVEENASNLADAGSTVEDTLSRCEIVKASLAKLLREVAPCVGAHRVSTCFVNANEEWQSSDVTIADGELLAVSAWGKWVHAGLGPSVHPGGVGSEGETGSAALRIIENFGNGALLLRIRGSDIVYPGWRSVRPENQGRVEFRINDRIVADNRGRLMVTMWVFRPLPIE